jgi:hypothetical protein
MAGSVLNIGSFSHISSEIIGNNHESNCKQCSEYVVQLNKALDELGSARKIIEILQKELSIYPTSNNASGSDHVPPKASSKPVNSTEWTVVPTRNHTRNPNKSGKHKVAASDQIIKTANRFSLLPNQVFTDDTPLIVNRVISTKGSAKKAEITPVETKINRLPKPQKNIY